MQQTLELSGGHSLQYLIYNGLALAVVILASILHYADKDGFRPYFGSVNPTFAVAIVGVVGTALLAVLMSRGWFTILRPDSAPGLLLGCGLSAVFAAIIILVDRAVLFPKDMNVPFPKSLAFYPAIGFVVEVVFHLLPLTVLLPVVTAILKSDQTAVIWGCIAIVAAIEPIYQVRGMAGKYSRWAVAYVALHVFLINAGQLALFQRYDFVTMYTMRLAYYLFWHILWGHLRLKVLF